MYSGTVLLLLLLRGIEMYVSSIRFSCFSTLSTQKFRGFCKREERGIEAAAQQTFEQVSSLSKSTLLLRKHLTFKRNR